MGGIPIHRAQRTTNRASGASDRGVELAGFRIALAFDDFGTQSVQRSGVPE